MNSFQGILRAGVLLFAIFSSAVPCVYSCDLKEADFIPPDWELEGEIENYNMDTLYEKINGAAEQYEGYNVVGLEYAGLKSKDNQYIDVYLYDMGTPLRAFGIFSTERTEGQPAVTLGRGGYVMEPGVFFWSGQYYVQLIASDFGEKLRNLCITVGDKLESCIKEDEKPIWGLDVLPREGRIEDSVQYLMKNALGLDFLTECFISKYQKGDKNITVFVSRQSSSDNAAEIFTAYADYIKNYAKSSSDTNVSGTIMLTGDMYGAFDVVFKKGLYVGGVTSADDQGVAEKTAKDFLQAMPAE